MEIKASVFHGEVMLNSTSVNSNVMVVVSNGTLTASYHSNKLLGGGLRACVNTQEEYDNNAMQDGILQFKLDCATALDAETFEVIAGSFYGNGERNCKVIAVFACAPDLASYVVRNKLTQYPFCVVQSNRGKEWNFEEWVLDLPMAVPA